MLAKAVLAPMVLVAGDAEVYRELAWGRARAPLRRLLKGVELGGRVGGAMEEGTALTVLAYLLARTY
jgi:hypothetical protein